MGKGVSGEGVGGVSGGRVVSSVGSSVLSVPAGTRGGGSTAWTEATARMARIAVDFMVSIIAVWVRFFVGSLVETSEEGCSAQ